MNKLLLDTHILVWWLQDNPKMDQKHTKILDDMNSTKQKKYISHISLWEIAKLVEYKKITINQPLEIIFQRLEKDPGFEIIHLSTEIIIESTRLGSDFHRDPADQLLVATARIKNLTLMTKDEKILKFNQVNTI